MSVYQIGSFSMITIFGRPGKDRKLLANITRNGVDNHATKEMASQSPEMTVQCVVDVANALTAEGLENSYAAAVGDFVDVTIDDQDCGNYEILDWKVTSISQADPAVGGLVGGKYLVRSECRLWRRGA